MANDIDYTTGPGGFSLTTNAPQAQAVGMPSLGGVGGPPGMEVFMALAQRRMAQERALREQAARQQQQEHELRMRLEAEQGARAAKAGAAAEEANRVAMERQQYQDQLARSGPPLKMDGQGPNQTPGYGIDTVKLNGYQRQLYMPNNAGIANSGSAVPTGSIAPVVPGVQPQPDEDDPFNYTNRTQQGMGGYRGNRVTGIGQR